MAVYEPLMQAALLKIFAAPAWTRIVTPHTFHLFCFYRHLCSGVVHCGCAIHAGMQLKRRDTDSINALLSERFRAHFYPTAKFSSTRAV